MNRFRSAISRAFTWLFGWIKGTDAAVCVGVLATFLWFVVDWCMSTTFRPMSFPVLYLVNITATLVLMLPWMLTGRKWVAITVIILLDILFESNLLYCRTYLSAIPPESYLIAGNMKDFMDSAMESVRWSDVGFILVTALTAVWLRKTKRTQQKRRGARYASLTAIFAGLSAIYISCLGGFYRAYDDLTQFFMTYASGPPTYTIAGHIAYKLMENSRITNPDPAELAEVDSWLNAHREKYRPTTVENPRKSIVLVICESLESWPIGLKIDGKEVTPYLNSLVADSTTFYAPNVLTQACTGRSIDGQLIYTTGLLPTSNAVFSMKYPDRTFPSLNKVLKRDRDTKSILLTLDKPITWNMGAVTQRFGYDMTFNQFDWKKDETIHRNVSDGSFFRQAVEKLKEGKIWKEGDPAMLTFVTFSQHHPYIINDALRDPEFDISGKGYPKELADYITLTHYVDSQLHTLVDYVNSRSDSADNMIVIVGDHEALASQRKVMRESSKEAAEMVSPHRFTPLIVLNAPEAGRYDGVLGQADVFPTVLDMLGVADDSWRGVGISVLDPTKPAVAFSAIPPERLGEADGASPAELDHTKEAQRVSELIIIHDLLKDRF